MSKKLILHDLSPEDAENLLPKESEIYSLYPAKPPVRHCVGCFGCWLKTPGRCVINDRGSDFSALMLQHDEIIVISRFVFGGLSPDIKAVFDRSIGFILPFFRILNGEMHHVKRYQKSPDLCYILYGIDINDTEKETARKLIAANALNFGSENSQISFHTSPREIREVLA